MKLSAFLLLVIIAVATVKAQPPQQCVTFCNSLQILMGTCNRECPSTTPRSSTTRRPVPSRQTTTASSTCGTGINFCTNPLNFTMSTECANNTAPLNFSWTTLGTLLQTGNAPGINSTMVGFLGNYFTSLGSMLSRQRFNSRVALGFLI